MTKKANEGEQVVPFSQISQLIGATSPWLPSEPVDAYKAGLQVTIVELRATTPLQIYLAEKIFDCLW